MPTTTRWSSAHGGDWGDATCGDGNNEVDATTCVASGLTAATSYDFRVRADSSEFR